MSIDLRALRNFVAIAAAGSISRAATNLHLAQPALSVYTSQLEEAIGTPLFERHSRGVTLTAMGERFLVHANEILHRVDLALEDMREIVSQPSGRVAIGLPQSLARYLAVPLVRHVLQHWPLVRIQIVEMNTGYVTENLQKRAIDLGMTFETEAESGISYTHLLDEELVFVSSKRQVERYHPKGAPSWKSIRLADLRSFPIILPTDKHSLRRRIDECLKRARLDLGVVAEVNAIPQLIELAAADIGSTVLSYAAVSQYASLRHLVVSRIVLPQLTRSVFLCRVNAAPLTIAAMMVQEQIKALIGEMTQTGKWPTSVKPL